MIQSFSILLMNGGSLQAATVVERLISRPPLTVTFNHAPAGAKPPNMASDFAESNIFLIQCTFFIPTLWF